MARYNQVGKLHTTIQTREGMTRVVYHKTEIVAFSNDTIILDAGGWRTPTTKNRMNQAANQFDLGYAVFQKGGEWFVEVSYLNGAPAPHDAMVKETYPFTDGMQITRHPVLGKSNVVTE